MAAVIMISLVLSAPKLAMKRRCNIRIHYFSLIVFAIANIYGCDAINPCIQKEVARNRSIDKKVDLVVVEKNCGATTSISKLVFVVPAKNSIDNFDPVFVADHVKKLDVKWVGVNRLNISYDKARIFSFTNFWHSKQVDNFKYLIDIREFQNTKDK